MRGRDQRESVLLFPYCTLERLPRAVFARFPANTARLGKYSTLGNRQVTANIPLPHYHSLPLPLLSSRQHTTCIIPSQRQRRAPISCIPLLPSLPFAAINNWFCRNFHVSRLFFQLAMRDYSKLYYHSLRLPDYHCTSQMCLHNKLYLHLYFHQYNKPVKAPPCKWQYGKNNTRVWSQA